MTSTVSRAGTAILVAVLVGSLLLGAAVPAVGDEYDADGNDSLDVDAETGVDEVVTSTAEDRETTEAVGETTDAVSETTEAVDDVTETETPDDGSDEEDGAETDDDGATPTDRSESDSDDETSVETVVDDTEETISETEDTVEETEETVDDTEEPVEETVTDEDSTDEDSTDETDDIDETVETVTDEVDGSENATDEVEDVDGSDDEDTDDTESTVEDVADETTETTAETVNATTDSVGETTNTTTETVSETTNTTAETVSETTNTTAETVSETTNTTGETTESVTNQTVETTEETTTDTVGNTVDTSTDAVEDTADTTTDTVGDTADTSTDAIAETTNTTTDTVSKTVDTTAGTVEGTTDTTADTVGTTGDAVLGTTGEVTNDVVTTTGTVAVEPVRVTTETVGGVTTRLTSTVSGSDGGDGTGSTAVPVTTQSESVTSVSSSSTDAGRAVTDVVRVDSTDNDPAGDVGADFWFGSGTTTDYEVADRSSRGGSPAGPVADSGIGGYESVPRPGGDVGAAIRSAVGAGDVSLRLGDVTPTVGGAIVGAVLAAGAYGAVRVVSGAAALGSLPGLSILEAALVAVRSLLLRLALLVGYSRYDFSDPLDNEKRASVYEAVEETPGINLTSLVAETGLAESTVRYHLRVLEEEDLLETAKIRGRRRFLPLSDDDAELVAAMSEEATREVIEALFVNEPATGTTLADALERDPSTVSHHLSRLSEAGLVEREADGPSLLNSLSADVRETLADAGGQPDVAPRAQADD